MNLILKMLKDLSKKVETNIFLKRLWCDNESVDVLEVANKKTIIDLSVNLMRDCIIKFTMVMRFLKQKTGLSEVEQFVDNLTMLQFKKIKDFLKRCLS